uniref:Uncharacterized protein n=1 Tax=Brassica oleracea var. oleracea TaxID=109376 RepID=A0A0D3DT46_BRAOL
MASQLSEEEERERAFTNRGRWNQLRSMGEAKNLLQCQLWEKDVEIKEMKDQFKEIVGLMSQSELRRKEAEKELKLREQALATSLASSPLGTPPSSVKHLAEDMITPSPMTVSAQKQLKFTPGIANGKSRGLSLPGKQARQTTTNSLAEVHIQSQGNRLDKLLLTHWQKFTFNPRYKPNRDKHAKFGIEFFSDQTLSALTNISLPLQKVKKKKKTVVLCE